MSDLIKREDAIKATWQEPTYADPLNILTEVRDRIEAIPSADRPQEWIPCSKKMPNEGDRIVVQYADGSLGLINSCRMRLWNILDSPYSKVVAWMYIDPWKGADDESD